MPAIKKTFPFEHNDKRHFVKQSDKQHIDCNGCMAQGNFEMCVKLPACCEMGKRRGYYIFESISVEPIKANEIKR